MKKIIIVSALLSSLIFSAFMIASCGTNPSGTKATTPYIYCSMTSLQAIFIINGTTNTSLEPISCAPYDPYQLAASPDNKLIYSTTHSEEVIVIETGANTVEAEIYVPRSNYSPGIAVSHDGDYLYLTSSISTEIYKVFLTAGNTVEVAMLQDFGTRLALNSDSTKAYVCLPNTLYKVEVVDLATMTGGTLVDVYNHPHDITVGDGKAYVAVSSNPYNVAVINLSDDTVQVLTHHPTQVSSIVSIPGQNKVYAADHTSPGVIYIVDTTVPTIEEKTITDEAFSNPGYMAATANFAYVIDPDPHYKIAVIDVHQDKVDSYIYGYDSNSFDNNPVVIYK